VIPEEPGSSVRNEDRVILLGFIFRMRDRAGITVVRNAVQGPGRWIDVRLVSVGVGHARLEVVRTRIWVRPPKNWKAWTWR